MIGKPEWFERRKYGGWGFHGVGVLGKVPPEVISIREKKGEEVPEDYRQNYAVQLSPLYTIADYPIKICDKVMVKRTGKDEKDEYYWNEKDKHTGFQNDFGYTYRPV